jgi:hypothetical protein
MAPSNDDPSLAKDALFTLFGDRIVEAELLVELLVEKGVFTQAEWDAAIEARYTAPLGRDVQTEARLNLDPEEVDAIDRFFSSRET